MLKITRPNAVAKDVKRTAKQSKAKRETRAREARGIGKVYQRANSTMVELDQMVDSVSLQQGTFELVGKLNGYAINPGSAVTFPWLSGIARRFEKYRFHNLEFTLVPNAPVTFAGRMYMAIDTDPLDEAPKDMAEFTTNKYQASSLVYQQCTLKLSKQDCDLLHTPYKYAFVKQVSGRDPPGRSSTVGRLYLASSAGQGGTTATLRVRGLVELVTPQYISDVPTVASIKGESALFPSDKPVTKTGPMPRPWIPVATNHTNSVGIDLSELAGDLATVAVTLIDETASPATAGHIMDSVTGWMLRVAGEGGRVLADLIYGDNAIPHVQYGQITNGPGFDENADGFIATLNLNRLRDAFPTARYLIPFVHSVMTSRALTPMAAVKCEL